MRNTRFFATILPLTIFFLVSRGIANAHDDLSLKIRANAPKVFAENKVENKAEVEIKEEQRVQVKREEFKIDGTTSTISIAENSFVIAGRTIFIDPVKVGKFRQKGVLAIGSRVKVEGVVIDGKSYAEDINVVGTGQGNSQIKVDQAENEISIKVKGSMNQILNFFKSIMVFLTTKPV